MDLEGDRLVFEFEAPEGGLEVPQGVIELRDPDGDPIARGMIDAQHSTRPGWFGGGLTIRLVLRIHDPAAAWSALAGAPETDFPRVAVCWNSGRGEVSVFLERA